MKLGLTHSNTVAHTGHKSNSNGFLMSNSIVRLSFPSGYKCQIEVEFEIDTLSLCYASYNNINLILLHYKTQGGKG